jgi:hypothetical protein
MKMAEFYEYQLINVSCEPLKKDQGGPGGRPTIADAANRWAKMGWRTVGVIPSQGAGYADSILIERKRRYLGIKVNELVLHPDDVTFIFAENE